MNALRKSMSAFCKIWQVLEYKMSDCLVSLGATRSTGARFAPSTCSRRIKEYLYSLFDAIFTWKPSFSGWKSEKFQQILQKERHSRPRLPVAAVRMLAWCDDLYQSFIRLGRHLAFLEFFLRSFLNHKGPFIYSRRGGGSKFSKNWIFFLDPLPFC